ncbi:MAG: hypothetical protein HYZ23_07515 [Chloroflexi bacterium]|nr:hypothetical protein [Chloroflexota bacterium]
MRSGNYTLLVNFRLLAYNRSDYYSRSLEMNPLGPNPIHAGRSKVQRGGAWDSSDTMVRSTYRGYDIPSNPFNVAGIRCVLGVAPPY